ncbi:hypothetical protein OE88DRAFT_1731629 [Heliocybe sulcata]|uniref:Photolyase/cryptochrome alpha/beta domain-containing protein n=1 Tax=Heliocybe sulcata TaxID=5364 RepID=A0A5C3NE45_9AGAM|nr:hypothetical protein OE88DRAFT_1731629 [Heliocybe sulcata]
MDVDKDGRRLAKKMKKYNTFLPRRVATAEAAASADAEPPLKKLLQAVKNGVKSPPRGEAVVYWMRMEDLRISDNRALSSASTQARRDGIPVVVIFIISPEDYIAQNRSPRRIDFTLRNLADIKTRLASEHIPLYIELHTPQSASLLSYRSGKDIGVCELATFAGIKVEFMHDRCLADPGTVLNQSGGVYTTFSYWHPNWLATLKSNLEWIEEVPRPWPNSEDIYSNPTLKALFDAEVPDHVNGFECRDRERMREVWPAGEDTARQILDRFLHAKARSSQKGASNPLSEGSEMSDKESRALVYKGSRDKADKDTTSRISPYLAAGVISARECVWHVRNLQRVNKAQATSATSLGAWLDGIAQRDFYNHLLVACLRGPIGRPLRGKYANLKGDMNEKHLQAWKEGRTGVPIVDAGMRQLNFMGWMHNRLRMITSTYLVKNLMIDWRLGEKYFMEKSVDGDLASNNGSWQLCAATSVNQRLGYITFNPYSQSKKADPTGAYIRHFVPELQILKGPDIHKPPEEVAVKLGYPLPLVKHKEVIRRVSRRYKHLGRQ